MNTINTVAGTELALPSTSGKPTPPPRKDSIPMLELNVTQQTIQETVTDMDRQGSKIQEITAETSSRRPEVILKETLRKLTQLKGLQDNRYLKHCLINCTYLFTYI